MEVLLSYGADINSCNNESVSVLVAAVKGGNKNCVKVLNLEGALRTCLKLAGGGVENGEGSQLFEPLKGEGHQKTCSENKKFC